MSNLRQVVIAMVLLGALSSRVEASYVAVQVGSDSASVYLKRGQVDLDYKFITRAARSDERVGALTIAVQGPDGTYLYRNTIPGITGWYHATFSNPADQVVSFWGKGGVHVGGPSGGHGAGVVIDVGTTISGGDQPTAIPSDPIPSNPQLPPVAKISRPEVHALIISGHNDLSRIVHGSMRLIGGIVGLGRQKEASGIWDPGFQIIPDPELLSASKIPPITPNLIDVRIVRFSMSARFLNMPSNEK